MLSYGDPAGCCDMTARCWCCVREIASCPRCMGGGSARASCRTGGTTGQLAGALRELTG